MLFAKQELIPCYGMHTMALRGCVAVKILSTYVKITRKLKDRRGWIWEGFPFLATPTKCGTRLQP